MLSLKGKKFGKLLVLDRSEKQDSKKSFYWICQCDCGNICEKLGSRLNSGKTKSCGCHKNETTESIFITTHGFSNHPLFSVWKNMLDRCFNNKNTGYENYGGRGITVCDRWSEKAPQGFLNFLEDMGERPEGLELDRIDFNGNYEKENCRWANGSTQSFNRRKNKNNKSGRTGVVWYGSRQKWFARISVNNRSISLGLFDDLIDAIEAREQAELKYYGFIKE